MTDDEIVRIDERSKRNEGRIKELETGQKALNKIASGVEFLVQSYGKLEVKVDKIDGKVVTIEQKPAKKWETVTEKIILVVVGAALTILFAKAGISI